jgi:hypothetical protein
MIATAVASVVGSATSPPPVATMLAEDRGEPPLFISLRCS